MAPPKDRSDPPRGDEFGCLELERQWLSRQENVLPMETAWNEGKFYGQVLKGRRQLTTVQRIGILLMGLQAIAFGAMIVFARGWLLPDFGPSLRSIDASLPPLPLIRVPVFLLEFGLGIRLCFVALKPRMKPGEPEDNS
ncbi:MAG: hypothetical protein WA369_01500 [Candidatus Acidiferrales bacterium]